MAGTVDNKVVQAEIGRTSLYKAVEEIAGAQHFERLYQNSLVDVRSKQGFEAMADEVVDLVGDEKLSEILARFFVVFTVQIPPNIRPMFFYQLYVHLRATGLMEPVKLKLVLVPEPGKGVAP